MIQVTKVWWDGEKLMAEPIDPTTIYQDPAQQEKCWNPTGEAHIAAIKKSSKAMVEDAAVRAVHKVMAEFEAKSDGRLMEPPAQQEPVAWKNAALRVGEDLCSVGPFGYYDMTAEQWLDWALSVVTVHVPPAQQEYERGFIDGMQEQMKRSVDRAVNAMAQQALDKKAENARDLGLDYEPAQRTWVGLTDEEITDIWAEASPYYHEDDFARAIEAKLKEKNT